MIADAKEGRAREWTDSDGYYAKEDMNRFGSTRTKSARTGLKSQ